ncbi:lytic polysaccharide monooxygenase [Planosporangium flavigriseum]|nr:lytic polysaccharide monooxygenase [Planosporangium flavigriseum]NJC63833.1 lytic polysaccharide monooxygenase [Planosporangium flavigriseum]
MAVPRTLARIALVVVAPLLGTGLVTLPAQAHGALDNPVSRVVACGLDAGQNARSAACKAAVAISGALAFTQWDNLRVANVGGRDREVIPDGKLCSGGLPAYKGLDLARADWPATRLTAGASFRFTYRETIPHKGIFRLYVTKDGYDPTRPLRWSDLESKPFLTATDPALTNGAYVMRGVLPAGKTGRHLIYTIWQNSSTPDTYYSCSDVVFDGAAGTEAHTSAPTSAAPATGAAPQATTAPARAVTLTPASSASSALPLTVGGAAVLAAVVGAAGFLLRRRRGASDALSGE